MMMPIPKLFLILSLLLYSTISTADATKKQCTTLSRGKELKQMVESSNVLVVLGEEDDAIYKELCERIESTPAFRIQYLEIALVESENLKTHILSKASPAKKGILKLLRNLVSPTASEEKSPEEESTSIFIFYSKNDTTGVIIDETTTDGVSQYISATTKQKKIGNFVYSLHTFDLIASQVMKSERTQQKFWALFVSKLCFYMHWVQIQTDFESELVESYVKISESVLTKGKDYPSKQVERLENMLNDSNSQINEVQKEKLSQRIFTLNKFNQPMETDEKDIYLFLGKLGLNIMTLLAMVLMIPMLIFGADGEEEEEEALKEDLMNRSDESGEDDESEVESVEEEPEETNEEEEEPVVATEKRLTKQEKRQLAVQRAKQAMHADKKKVLAVKQKKNERGSSNDEELPSRSTLSKMTVIELKDLLRQRGLKVGGKKAELIDRLLG
jgi:hypothetical protein